MVYHKILNLVPHAIQQDLVFAYLPLHEQVWIFSDAQSTSYKKLRKEERQKAREKQKDTDNWMQFQKIGRSDKRAFLHEQF